jgi:hypothetical protein
MAGSLKWFNYTADNGNIYAVFADESNTEAVNGSSSGYNPATATAGQVPKGVSIRYGEYESPNGQRSIRVPILTPALYTTLLIDGDSITDPINSANPSLDLVRLTPEKTRRQPKISDTGLNDGDNP